MGMGVRSRVDAVVEKDEIRIADSRSQYHLPEMFGGRNGTRIRVLMSGNVKMR
jgi:hypothetical protein